MTHPIKAYRTAHDLTLAEFGELVGTKRWTVWKWEDGDPMSIESALKVHRLTGIPKEKLRPDVWEAVGERQ